RFGSELYSSGPDQSIIHCRGHQWNSRCPSDGPDDVVDANSKCDGPVYVATLFEGTGMAGTCGHARCRRSLCRWSFLELSKFAFPADCLRRGPTLPRCPQEKFRVILQGPPALDRSRSLHSQGAGKWTASIGCGWANTAGCPV